MTTIIRATVTRSSGESLPTFFGLFNFTGAQKVRADFHGYATEAIAREALAAAAQHDFSVDAQRLVTHRLVTFDLDGSTHIEDLAYAALKSMLEADGVSDYTVVSGK